MENDYLKDILIELQNIYEELKSNKDKRMLKKLNRNILLNEHYMFLNNQNSWNT